MTAAGIVFVIPCRCRGVVPVFLMLIGAVFMFSHSLLASSVVEAVDVAEEDVSILHLQGGAQSELHAPQRFERTYDVRPQEAVEVADRVGGDVVEERIR